MSVCLSYMWLFWRRKSALLGLIVIGLLVLLSVHSISNGHNPSYTPNYYVHDHHSGEGHNGQFAGGKKLQQSSNIIEDEGVKFIPAKKQHKYEIVDEATRRKVAAKHRQVPPPSKIKVGHAFDEELETGMKLQPFQDSENGDYNQRPIMESYLNAPVYNPPVYRGDHGVDPGDQDYEKSLYVPKQRLVHIDLKGAPPKMEFLLKFLKLIKDWGATGILIEYEDTFPFEGILKDVAAGNHYTKQDIYNLLIKCKELNLEVIPLVQTFGHMEFILKHGQFAHLRDNSIMPESICPCHEQAMHVISLYIDQVMALHKDVKHLHIGCDEVYHLGECSQCAGQARTDVFVNHVKKVANYVKTKYPQIQTVIIWDDMLRNLMGAEMMPLQDLVVPMVWVYAEEVYRFMPTYNWDRFSEVFPTAWTASAYKGADGPTASVPNVQKRLNNNLNWLDVMSNEESKFKKEGFQGIVLTGWSRYDHFAVLAELLPPALPSLATNLLSVKHGYFNASWQKEFYKDLECADNSRLYEEFIDLETDPLLQEKLSWCFFPGSAIFKMIHNLGTVQSEIEQYLQKYSAQEGWITEYNIRHNYSSPFRVNEGLDEYSRMSYLLTALIKQAQTALAEIYDHHTVSEWIEQKIYPMHKDLSEFKARAESLKSRNTWPKRPFPVIKAVQAILTSTTTSTTPNAPSQQDPVTVRPKRLVQAPDYYRHPPGSF